MKELPLLLQKLDKINWQFQNRNITILELANIIREIIKENKEDNGMDLRDIIGEEEGNNRGDI